MKPKAITEEELAVFLDLQQALGNAKSVANSLEKEVKAIEGELIARLQAGAKVKGKWQALLLDKVGAVRPSWKDAFKALALRCGLSPAQEELRVVAECGPAPITKVLHVVKPPEGGK